MGQTSNFEEQVEPPVLLFQPELKISDSVTVRPFDVSKTPSDNQYKSKLSVFPTRNGKRFQSDWYLKFPWIEYSQERDSVFCFACSHSPQHDTPDNFTSIGFHDWNHGVQKLQLSGLGLMALTDRNVDYDVFMEKFSQICRRIQLK